MRKRLAPKLGDTVRLPSGEQGTVIGTMTTQLPERPNLDYSICVLPPSGPIWVGVEDVAIVAKVKGR